MALDKKQKLMIPLVVVAFLFLGWEAYKLLLDNGNQYTPPADPVVAAPPPVDQSAGRAGNNNPPSEQTRASNPPSASPSASPNNPPASVSAQGVNTAGSNTAQTTMAASSSPSTEVGLKTTSTPSSEASKPQDEQATLTAQQKAALARQKALEQQYIQMVTQYQFAQMQKKLADVNVALLQAKLKEAQTAAKAQTQSVSVSGVQHQNVNSSADTLSRYRLLYIGRVNGHWVATLRYAGSLQDVSVGSKFANGTFVRVIDRNGVVLQNKGVSRYLMISSPLSSGADQSGEISDEGTSGSISLGEATDRQSQTRGPSEDINTQTTQSAEQVYDTLSKLQQAMPSQ